MQDTHKCQWGPVRLRALKEEDREMIVTLLTDEVVGRTFMVPDGIDRPLAEQIFRRYQERALIFPRLPDNRIKQHLPC